MVRRIPLPLIAVAAVLSTPTCGHGASSAPAATAALRDETSAAAQSSAFANGSSAFGFKLLQEMAIKDQTGNILISPLSLADCLMLAYNGARGTTQSEIASALGLPAGEDDADQTTADLNASLATADPTTEIDIANGLWARSGATFKPSYSDLCLKDFNAPVRTIDFDSPDGAAAINDWVKDATKGRIDRLADTRTLHESSAVLTNAVYFHGQWATKFTKTATQDRPFTLADGSVKQIPLMAIQHRYAYYEDDDVQVVALPYGNGRLRMIVALPKSGNSLGNLVNGLSTDAWTTMTGSMRPQMVRLSMPKFQMDFRSSQMVDDLAAIGIKAAFSRDADFSAMSDQRLVIGKVVHVARMQVDEEGTVASAATGMFMAPMAAMRPEQPVVMVVDHPFFCAVCDRDTGAVLFEAVVRDPQQ